MVIYICPENLRRMPKKTTHQQGNVHQDYNNIFQENLDEIAEMLIKEVFQLSPLPIKKLSKKKIHRTHYREPDFLVALTNDAGEHMETLHGEVHLKDELEISYRAAEYAAMELREFRKPVRVFILYLGTGKSKHIQSQLDGGCIKVDILVQDISALPVSSFLSSDRPERIILGILADFGTQSGVEIIHLIIHQLNNLTKEHERLQKYYKQLEILSNLRKLQPEVIKQVKHMPLDYNIKTDLRYQQGVEEGIEKGIEKGFGMGVSQKTLEVIVNLILQSDHTNLFIAGITGTDVQFVEEVRSIIKANPENHAALIALKMGSTFKQ